MSAYTVNLEKLHDRLHGTRSFEDLEWLKDSAAVLESLQKHCVSYLGGGQRGGLERAPPAGGAAIAEALRSEHCKLTSLGRTKAWASGARPFKELA